MVSDSPIRFASNSVKVASKAQAASLKGLKQSVIAKKLATPKHGTTWLPAFVQDLRKGDVFLVEANDVIAIDGEVIEGVATVDESAITGESAPVIRESGGDFSSVTGGTRVLSDWLVVRVTSNPGEAFIDRMIAMVEGAKRQKTPNEVALTILLIALTIIFLVVTVTLLPAMSAVTMSPQAACLRAAMTRMASACPAPRWPAPT